MSKNFNFRKGGTFNFAKRKNAKAQKIDRRKTSYGGFKNKIKKLQKRQKFDPLAALEENAPDTRITSLWKCETKEDVHTRLTSTYDRFAEKALAAFKKRVLDDDKRKILELAAGGEIITSVPLISHKSVMLEASSMLGDALTDIALETPDIEVAFVTAIAGDGGTSHTQPTIELHLSQQRFKRTLNAISPNFFGVSELALFNSHSHPAGGQLLQRHEHGLVWGPDCLSRAQEIAKTHASRYPANTTEAPQLVVRKVKVTDINLHRIVSYLFEAPCKCSTWCPPKDDRQGHMHHGEKGDRNVRYLRMSMLRTMLSLEDISFAGGSGKAIRSNIIKRARAMVETHKRLLHPDAVASTIMEISAALGKPNWALPIIARRK